MKGEKEVSKGGRERSPYYLRFRVRCVRIKLAGFRGDFLRSIQTIACALQFRLSSGAKSDELFLDPQLHSAARDHNSEHLCATQRCGTDSCVGIHVFRCLVLLFFSF